MTASHDMILVLWAQSFDEIAASIFVAELRRLGRRVKLVGLSGQQIAGRHGVALVPDLPLGQALRAAKRIECLIVPAPFAALQQFSYDPRLAELFGVATNHQALIVTRQDPSHDSSDDSTEASALLNGGSKRLEYPAIEELLAFVQSTLCVHLRANHAPT